MRLKSAIAAYSLLTGPSPTARIVRRFTACSPVLMAELSYLDDPSLLPP